MKHRNWTGIIAAMCMLLIILDSKTTFSGAQEGLKLCIMTAIPALLPFFFLSILLTSALSGSRFSTLRSIGRLVRIPAGSESLFLIGLLGGYPTGAQSVSQAFQDGTLKKSDAIRMLGFCSNAGPAFIFGIASNVFSDKNVPWILWLIHIVSAILVGMVLPGGCNSSSISISKNNKMNLPTNLRKCITIMAQVCGWIILFRVVMSFLNRWIFWIFNEEVIIFLNGIIELTNGCTALPQLHFDGLRFIFYSVFLAFGGLCVAMQTGSVTGSLGYGMYFQGKFLQSGISFLMAALYQQAAFPYGTAVQIHPLIYLIVTAILLISILILQKNKNYCSISAVGVV